MFTFKLEFEDGTPADRPTLTAAVPDWKAGDTIRSAAGRFALSRFGRACSWSTYSA